MDTTLKAFLVNLGAHIGGSAQDAAIECVRIATNVPSLAGCLPNGASPQTTTVDVTLPAAASTVVEAELSDAKATIVRLQDEVAALKAGQTNARAASEAPATPAAPKAPKAAKAPSASLSDAGNLKAIVVDGVETPVRSWRAGAMHALGLLTAAGKKADVPGGWFRDDASDRTVTLPSGDHAFASIVTGECEKRIRKVVEVLGLSVTLRIAAEDGTTQDVAL